MNLDKVFIFDIETTGLLDHIKSEADLHVLSVGWVDSEGVKRVKSTANREDIFKIFANPENTLVGHNIICFDIPALKKMFPDIVVKATLIDTLPISWYLYDGKKQHGLEHWGTELGVEKPEISDWENLSFEEYKHRCETDVLINMLMYEKFLVKLRRVYESNLERIPKLVSLLTWIMQCSHMQEINKILVDVEKLEETIKYFSGLKDGKIVSVKKAMPQVAIKKIANFPKAGLYKKDGSLSVAGEKYLSYCKGAGVGLDYTGPIEVITGYNEPNPNSADQKKAWLYSLNWKPQTFKHNRNKVTNEVNIVEQIMTEEKMLCPSVLKLIEKEPAIEDLDGLTVLTHRLGLLNGFKNAMDENNMISQTISKLTVTMRWAHRTVVNLPKYTGKGDIRDGKWIRECLISGAGKKIIQSDLSGIESRTSDHYTFHLNPERIKKTKMPYFDPHCEIAVTSNLMSADEETYFIFKSAQKDKPTLEIDSFSELYKPTEKVYDMLNLSEEEQKDFMNKLKSSRSKAKTTNYASLYLVSAATLSRNLEISKSEAQKLIDAYWKIHFAVKKVSESFLIKDVDGENWVYNPIAKFWYYCRNTRNVFSTVNQSSAVYCFNVWLFNCTRRGYWPRTQSHDDLMFVEGENEVQKVIEVIQQAMEDTNKQLKLNVELACETQVGNNVAETH